MFEWAKKIGEVIRADAETSTFRTRQGPHENERSGGISHIW